MKWPPRCCRAACAVLAAGLMLSGSPRLASAEEVDLQLLLAVDVSPSVDLGEYAMQIHGLANAVRDPVVVEAISLAAPNGVAIALMQWAGPREQVLSVPWHIVRDQASAEAFAAKMEMVVRPVTNGGTAIGNALASALTLLSESRFRAARQVIDISGDGRTNVGDSPAPVRSRAVSLGVIVNGLVIRDEELDLDSYYLKRVIGGPGSFVMDVQTFGDYARAIRLKLLREIVVAMTTSPLPADGEVAVPKH